MKPCPYRLSPTQLRLADRLHWRNAELAAYFVWAPTYTTVAVKRLIGALESRSRSEAALKWHQWKHQAETTPCFVCEDLKARGDSWAS